MTSPRHQLTPDVLKVVVQAFAHGTTYGRLSRRPPMAGQLLYRSYSEGVAAAGIKREEKRTWIIELAASVI